MNNRFINPSGFAENLPAAQILEDGLKAEFATIAESFGYTHLETASVEYMDTLASKGDVSKEIYTIGRALGEGEESTESARGLHFDLTVPFARYVAQHQGQLDFPYRRYQVQKVWRGERPQKGRFREFYQADIDVVGQGTLALEFDAEVALTMGQILDSFNIGGMTMHINNRKFLSGLLAQYGINSEDTLHAIDKLDKIGKEAVIEKICSEHGVTADSLTDLFTIFASHVAASDVSAYLETINGDNELLAEGKRELTRVFALLAQNPTFENVSFVFSPAIARGLDYYTGTVYETTINGLEKYGSICSGGRYAELASRFTTQQLPGVGLSIGLTRLMSIITSEDLIALDRTSPSEVGLCMLQTEQETATLETAHVLRRNGFNVEIDYRTEAGLGKQLTVLEKKGIPFAVICEADGWFTVCNLATTAKQKVASIEEVITLVTII